MLKSDVLIIGAGPVGIFASFKAGMLGMSSIIADSLNEVGGQCSALYPEKPIYDIPAYPKILAKDLVQNLQEQAAFFNPQYLLETRIISFEKEQDLFVSTCDNGLLITSKIIIIASGAGAFGPNRPPLDFIENYENKSVFYKVNQIQDFAAKTIIIAGGGDSAIDWALNLADSAKKIYLIHRRAKFRASPASIAAIEQLQKEAIVEILTPYQLSKINGEDGYLTKVTISNIETGEEKILDGDILLPFFGLTSDLGPLKNWGLNIINNTIEVDQSSQMTNIEGIYAVGDICNYKGKLKLIMTGFSECATALHHSYNKVFDGKTLHFSHSTSMKFEN
ncbi:MAG: NAD(P)/FAD-dependent oxidoreductase [Rickettsiaceae bacterium]|nr:NAD(P)/FAD-dependent oxidoreductase [Rickettsiaceae bacterium]